MKSWKGLKGTGTTAVVHISRFPVPVPTPPPRVISNGYSFPHQHDVSGTFLAMSSDPLAGGLEEPRRCRYCIVCTAYLLWEEILGTRGK
jgi:hypothetical protein